LDFRRRLERRGAQDAHAGGRNVLLASTVRRPPKRKRKSGAVVFIPIRLDGARSFAETGEAMSLFPDVGIIERLQEVSMRIVLIPFSPDFSAQEKPTWASWSSAEKRISSGSAR
jgi:hypothetical protein